MFRWFKSRWLSSVIDEEKSVPKISEPITSFLETFTSNPKRFKILSTLDTEDLWAINGIEGSRTTYTMTDSFTSEIFKLVENHWAHSYFRTTKSTQWMTQDEVNLVVRRVKEYYKARWGRLSEIKRIRANRDAAKERTRLTKIYQEALKND